MNPTLIGETMAMKRLILLTLAWFSTGTLATAQPSIDYSGHVEWDDASATITFRSSGAMASSKEGFFWEVPSSVKQVVIASNVQVTGGFRVGFRKESNPLRITGENRTTSVIYGTDELAWTDQHGVPENEKWKYSSISVLADATVHISNLTACNPRGYIISGYANKAVIHVDSCTLRDTREGDNNNSDGFAGAAGSSIRNSLISTRDDGIKIYHDISIENVTIEHHRNGAPLQFGWGGGSKTVNASIKGLHIKGVDPDDRYNMAPLTWEHGQGSTRNVTIEGLEVSTKGMVYCEEKGEWEPVGLLELKPTGCTFNLHVTDPSLHGLPLGTINTNGTISLPPET